MSTFTKVLFKTIKNTGIIILNRPNELNAIDSEMTARIVSTLKEWERSKKLVIIKSIGGRAFSAGGCLKELCNQNKDRGQITKIEYRLNAYIGTYKIPYISFIDGIVMGGGAGVSIHGSHRIATERTLFAMPEVAIGFYPDVGSSHFLQLLPGKLGLYLGLTGTRLHGIDTLRTGIATHYVKSCDLGKLEDDLTCCANSDDLNAVLSKYSSDFDRQTPSVLDNIEKINYCFDSSTIEEIFRKLEADNSEWARDALDKMRKVAPTSLKLTLRLHQHVVGWSLRDCLAIEYRLSLKCLKSWNMMEGIRAVIIDKDNAPQWIPKYLEDVSDSDIDNFFKPIGDSNELWYETSKY